MSKDQIDSTKFFSRLRSISSSLQKVKLIKPKLNSFTYDALLIVHVKVSDHTTQNTSTVFQLWLMDCQFTDTAILIKKDSVNFLTSTKKGKMK